MKKSLILFAITLLSISTLSFAATMQSLNKEQVMQTMEDKTMTTIPLVTLNGQLIENTLAVYISKDNKLSGQLSSKPSDGPKTDQGTWTVKGNGVLCATWENWNEKKPICIFVYKTNNALIFVNQDTKNFESMALQDNIKPGNQLV